MYGERVGNSSFPICEQPSSSIPIKADRVS